MNKNIEQNINYNDCVIKKLTEEQILFLKDNVEFSSKCLEYLDNELKNFNNDLDYYIWKICVFDNMFFNLPFTLEDVIFIPISYINKSIVLPTFIDKIFYNNINLINKNFSKTLIHEKIHLLQRYNQKKWNEYIVKNTNWIIVDKEIISNITFINNNQIIYNPDTYYLNTFFLYSINKNNTNYQNNNKYYGLMLFNSKFEIKNIWFLTKEMDDKIFLYPVTSQITIHEHPYEELAYNLANKLIYYSSN
jgi:hypothetical protein